MITLERLDSVPLASDDFSAQFSSWLTVMVDALGSIIDNIENGFNNLAAQSYTTVQITALAVNAPNGSIWYDSTTNQLKAKVNGVVVVLA